MEKIVWTLVHTIIAKQTRFDRLCTGPGLDVSPHSRSLLDVCIAAIISIQSGPNSAICRLPFNPSLTPEPVKPERVEALAGKMTGEKDRRVGTRHGGLTIPLYRCLFKKLYGVSRRFRMGVNSQGLS